MQRCPQCNPNLELLFAPSINQRGRFSKSKRGTAGPVNVAHAMASRYPDHLLDQGRAMHRGGLANQ